MLKNITLSAEDDLIKIGRLKASAENTTINEKFRQWLASYVNREQNEKDYRHLMEKLSDVTPGKKFSRDDLNER